MTFTSLDFGVRCDRYGLETKEHIPLRIINGIVWYGYSLLSWIGLSYLFVLWAQLLD
jgi:hypothetical protein